MRTVIPKKCLINIKKKRASHIPMPKAVNINTNNI